MKYEDIYHVLPYNDLKNHVQFCELSSRGVVCKCDCKPKYIFTENDCLIVFHNSYDGREGVEWANEILNSK